MGLFDFEVKKTDKSITECKGLFFRCSVSMCTTSHKGVLERRELRLLKRKSCKGCCDCEWIMEFLHEEIWGGEPDSLLCGLRDGAIYQLKIHTYPGPYEYPLEYDYEYEFVEVKE